METVIVNLIKEDLKCRRLFKTLTAIGLSGSWCETDLSEVIFMCVGIHNPTDWQFVQYYQMLDMHVETLTENTNSLTASACAIYTRIQLEL